MLNFSKCMLQQPAIFESILSLRNREALLERSFKNYAGASIFFLFFLICFQLIVLYCVAMFLLYESYVSPLGCTTQNLFPLKTVVSVRRWNCIGCVTTPCSVRTLPLRAIIQCDQHAFSPNLLSTIAIDIFLILKKIWYVDRGNFGGG